MEDNELRDRLLRVERRLDLLERQYRDLEERVRRDEKKRAELQRVS